MSFTNSLWKEMCEIGQQLVVNQRFKQVYKDCSCGDYEKCYLLNLYFSFKEITSTCINYFLQLVAFTMQIESVHRQMPNFFKNIYNMLV